MDNLTLDKEAVMRADVYDVKRNTGAYEGITGNAGVTIDQQYQIAVLLVGSQA